MLIAGGISVLLALLLAGPVHTEVATRSAFAHDRLTSAVAIVDEIEYGYNTESSAPVETYELRLENGPTLIKPHNHRGPSVDEGQRIPVGVLDGELVSVDGQYVREPFSFFHLVLLMVLAGLTVYTGVTLVRGRRNAPTALFYAWPAGWLVIPVGMGLSVVVDTAWWPVITLASNTGFFLTLYVVNYLRVTRAGTMRTPLTR